MSAPQDTSAWIPRERGDDVLITLRVRRSAFDRLTSDDGMQLPVLSSLLQLRPEPEPDTYALAIWTPEVPPYRGWSEPIPANEDAKRVAEERER